MLPGLLTLPLGNYYSIQVILRVYSERMAGWQDGTIIERPFWLYKVIGEMPMDGHVGRLAGMGMYRIGMDGWTVLQLS